VRGPGRRGLHRGEGDDQDTGREERDVRDVADEPVEVGDEVDDMPLAERRRSQEPVEEVRHGAAEQQAEADRPCS